jgi:mersacidin/lichenicidin family type 2 lantibiotic
MNRTVRAWKDARYRRTLTDAERAALPPHPAGAIELSSAELETVAGAGCSAMTRVCNTHSGSCDCYCTA